MELRQRKARCSARRQHRLWARLAPFFNVFKESSCQLFCITGYISEATRMRSTRSCRGLAGTSIAVPSTCPQYASSSRKSGVMRPLPFVRLLLHSLLKGGTRWSGPRISLARRGVAHYPASISTWATRSTVPEPADGPYIQIRTSPDVRDDPPPNSERNAFLVETAPYIYRRPASTHGYVACKVSLTPHTTPTALAPDV
jgi:hypothetical protein